MTPLLATGGSRVLEARADHREAIWCPLHLDGPGVTPRSSGFEWNHHGRCGAKLLNWIKIIWTMLAMKLDLLTVWVMGSASFQYQFVLE